MQSSTRRNVWQASRSPFRRSATFDRASRNGPRTNANPLNDVRGGGYHHVTAVRAVSRNLQLTCQAPAVIVRREPSGIFPKLCHVTRTRSAARLAPAVRCEQVIVRTVRALPSEAEPVPCPGTFVQRLPDLLDSAYIFGRAADAMMMKPRCEARPGAHLIATAAQRLSLSRYVKIESGVRPDAAEKQRIVRVAPTSATQPRAIA